MGHSVRLDARVTYAPGVTWGSTFFGEGGRGGGGGYEIWVISNGNWTEWSTIQGVIGRVISKLAERVAQGRFRNYEHDYPRIVRHKVQLPINRINNKMCDNKCDQSVLQNSTEIVLKKEPNTI